MDSPAARYTLLIPTFNRPAYLRSLLGYLEARKFEYPVRVLDSSSDDALSQNRETIDRVRLDLVYELYPPDIGFCSKVTRAIVPVKSTYCSFCADDDVLFIDQLGGLFDFLDANPAFVVAHGYYVNFKPGDDADIWYTVYSAPSIAGDDALKRIVQQMNDYQAIFYGVHRTSTMKLILTPLERVKSLWAQEMLASSLALVAGGAYRMPDYFMARNTNRSIASEGWHPHQFFAIEPAELFREYADYRTVTLEYLAADARCQSTYRVEQMQRVFDLVHLKYLAPLLSTGVMTYLIRQSMRPDITPQQIIDDIWKIFVQPSDNRAGGLRHNLRTGGLARLRHLARLYRALRFQEGFHVSSSWSLDGMTVKRRARDGRFRRYLLPGSLLNQELADGGQVTATHLRTIIGHLDDYV